MSSSAPSPSSGSDRSLMAILALIIASPFAVVLGLGGGGNTRDPAKVATPVTSTATTTAETRAPPGYCIDRLLQPFYDLASVAPAPSADPDPTLSAAPPAAPAAQRAPLDVRLGALSGRLLSTSCLGVEALIATVPDPLDSGLAYGFDTALQALRLGVEQGQASPDATSYYRDREWLPWDDAAAPPSQRTQSEECRNTVPGVILFRGGSPTRPRILALLLVGETPTTGVHGAAMTSALQIAASLEHGGQGETCRRSVGDPCPLCTRIIGPTYSGSASSLRQTIKYWVESSHDANPIRIISGTASGDRVAGTLRNQGTTDPWLPNDVTFFATTATAEAEECAYLGFLKAHLGVDEDDDDEPGMVARAMARLTPATRSSANPALTPGTAKPRPLHSVAMLHESGTEFGSDPHPARCGLEPAVDVSFPVHVAALRTAYEQMDQQSAERDPTIARPTSLQVSLGEKRRPLDIEADLSQVTTNARDVALSNLLGAISHDGVRHVGIQATDIADAIFIARKIRDVSPDVRIAFFEADALLTHESFRQDLYGSLVVSSYPFLGTDDFARAPSLQLQPLEGVTDAPHLHMAFENSGAEGTFNATQAARGVSFDRLREYSFDRGRQTALPMWISVVGEHGLAPVSVAPPLDCDGTIYGGTMSAEAHAAERVLCGETSVPPPEEGHRLLPPVEVEPGPNSTDARKTAWEKFDQLDAARLDLDPDNTPARIWHFAYAGLMVGFLVDQVRQGRQRRFLAKNRLPDRRLRDGDDRTADLAIGRTKWGLYAAIRTYVLTFLLWYMSAVYLYVFNAYGCGWQLSVLRTWFWAVGAAVIVLLWAAACTGWAFWRFLADYAAFGRSVGASSLFTIGRSIRRVYGWIGSVRGRPSWASWSGLRASARRSTPWPVGRLPWTDFWRRVVGGVPRWSRRARAGEGDDVQGGAGRTSLMPPSSWDVLSRPFGFSQFDGDSAFTSFAQLRRLLTLTVVVVATFLWLLLREGMAVGRVDWVGMGPQASPAMTLYVLRNLPLFSGVSPAVPLFLLTASVYAWAVGRMARLALAHSLSCISPEDGVADLVSTPLTGILYPLSRRRLTPVVGFTAIERALLNAIWRPGTGLGYFGFLAGIVALPVVLFLLKPLSTLEDRPGTAFLAAGLALSAILSSATVIQLWQYWLALRALLRRMTEHPLGRSFARVAPFVRDTIVDQLSRTPNDLLRLVACAQDLIALFRSAARFHGDGFFGEIREAVSKVERLTELRAKALEASGAASSVGAAEAEAELGKALLLATAGVSRVLELAWAGTLTSSAAALPAVAAPDLAEDGRTREGEASEARGPAVGGKAILAAVDGEGPNDALTPVAWRYTKDELTWLRSAQSNVATVATVLLNRHLRQYRVFLYTLTWCALLLLAAVVSYPFEPHRLLVTCIWVMMGVVVGSGFWIYVELDQNTLMSYVSGTTPGKITVDGAFAVRFVTWVVLPLLGVAAAQYPRLADAVVRVAEPFARALK